MNKPVGGRGKKAPYKTVVIRVPEYLADEFRKEIDFFHALISEGESEGDITARGLFKYHGRTDVNVMEAITEAKTILKQKKSARVTTLKLLQVLYGEVVTEDVLE